MNKIHINSESIRLSQLLKLANAVGSGAEAKFVVQGGQAKVNGERELRRGRKLKPGDLVEYAGMIYEVVSGAE